MNSLNIYSDKGVVNKYHLSRNIPYKILANYASQIVTNTSPRSLCDVGFGKGSTLIPFARHKETRVYGIDSSEEMVSFVRNELSKRNLFAKVIDADAKFIEPFIGELDLVHMKAVTHIPKDPYKFLMDVTRAVRLGEHFVIGKENSQPEDNMENIGKYGLSHQEDFVLKNFYEEYFKIRTNDGKPFRKPKMPAGDYDEAVRFLTERDFVFEKEITTPAWTKNITLSELVEAISEGTFTVFRKGCSQLDRKDYAKKMEAYCHAYGYSLDVKRPYRAQLKAVILRKEAK